jgi:hypothetical protein
MSIKNIIIILILIAIGVYFCMFYNKKQKVYFFLNKDDTNSVESFESLNKILKNSDYEVIVVNYDTDNTSLLELNKVTSYCRAVDKVLNIEKMTDLTQIYFDTCYRNAKCVNQPSNKFYEIYNTIGVFGYPFKFQDNASELLGNKTKTNNLIDVRKDKTCSRPHSVDVDSPPWQRRRSLDY